MVTSLAHELNQRLAAILSNAEAAGQFLNRESPNLARVRGCLTAIVADDERAAGVIKRLRALLKKDRSQASLINLNEVVSDALRLVNNDAMLRETRVRIELHPKLPPVLVDRVQLCQVVLNLLVNGLQAAAEQPPVERWVLVRTAEAYSGVELTVGDSGKGIAESDLARVFEPFFTTKREGLGMGLSISQSIVEAHGGRIWAQNSAGAVRSSIACCPWHNRLL
jgi:C4-dicarboxylate-specific signal transduction histidine kinase